MELKGFMFTRVLDGAPDDQDGSEKDERSCST